MIKKVHEIIPEVAEAVRGGSGTVSAHKLLDLYPGSAIKSVGVVRLEPGASIGDHSHEGDEDFYYCLSGCGVVIANGLTSGVLRSVMAGEDTGTMIVGSAL